MLTVALDYRPALFSGFGIGRYVKNLTPALLAEDPELRLKLYGVFLRNRRRTLREHAWPDRSRAAFHGAPLPARLVPWMSRFLPVRAQMFTGPFDLYHDTDYALTPVGRAPRIATLYDTAYLREGEWVSEAQSRHMHGIVRGLLRNVTRIITISEFAKGEIMDAFGIPAERIDVTYLGVDPAFLDPEPAADYGEILRAYRIREPYVLYLGTLEPRKNLVRLLRAFGGLLNLAPEFQLVLAGRRGWGHERILETVAEGGLESSVLLPGPLPDPVAVELVKNASVLAYPSLYEGFGLPALEGMAAGVPVLSSDSHALREVCGDGALLVDPLDDQAMLEGLRHLALDRASAYDIADRGRRRARAFTWRACAQRTLSTYRRAVEERA